MKLVRFATEGNDRVGIAVSGGIVDLVLAESAYATMEAIIRDGAAALDALTAVAARVAPHHAVDAVRLLPPVRPSKYLAIGMNYAKHAEEAEELGVKKQAKQFWFNKQVSCIAGPYDDIDPGVTEKLDYEVELGVVIGKSAKYIRPEDAADHIFGYTVLNDVSARDWQFHSPTFTLGKSFDTHGPMGPWIVTADEIADCHALDLRCYVNGDLRQSSNTGQMIHNVHDQISYLSTAFTLWPGDILATGTPEGVGISRKPPIFLEPGDVVRCEVEGIGYIENRVVPSRR